MSFKDVLFFSSKKVRLERTAPVSSHVCGWWQLDNHPCGFSDKVTSQKAMVTSSKRVWWKVFLQIRKVWSPSCHGIDRKRTWTSLVESSTPLEFWGLWCHCQTQEWCLHWGIYQDDERGSCCSRWQMGAREVMPHGWSPIYCQSDSRYHASRNQAWW